jgi:hypothetical protein
MARGMLWVVIAWKSSGIWRLGISNAEYANANEIARIVLRVVLELNVMAYPIRKHTSGAEAPFLVLERAKPEGLAYLEATTTTTTSTTVQLQLRQRQHAGPPFDFKLFGDDNKRGRNKGNCNGKNKGSPPFAMKLRRMGYPLF